MNINELMIGDWVKCSDPTPFRVRGIYNDEPWMVEDENGLKVCLGDLQPIQFSHEILEANGFVAEYEDFYIRYHLRTSKAYSFNDIELIVGSDNVHYRWDCVDVTIKTVSSNVSISLVRSIHHFQNILRDCGLTELADNFKLKM